MKKNTVEIAGVTFTYVLSERSESQSSVLRGKFNSGEQETYNSINEMFMNMIRARRKKQLTRKQIKRFILNLSKKK